jgi:hypothetical protein
VRQFPSTSLRRILKSFPLRFHFLPGPGRRRRCLLPLTDRKHSIFILLLRRDLVFPLRSKAPHNGKTAVCQKKNRASLFSVEALDYCRNSASGFGLAGSEILTTSYCVSPADAAELFEETMRTPFDP